MQSGEKELVWYQKPGSRIRTARCGTCFIRLFREMEGEDGKLVKRVRACQYCYSSEVGPIAAHF